jgi:hypothetical protein
MITQGGQVVHAALKKLLDPGSVASGKTIGGND